MANPRRGRGASGRSHQPPARKAGPPARNRPANRRATRRRAQRRRRLLLPLGSVGIVLTAVAIFLGVSLTTGPATANEDAAPATVVSHVTNLPLKLLSQIGGGQATTSLQPVRTGSPLRLSNRVGIVFISEESCPFCAAERWPIVIALSHFGKWSNLGATTSSSTDVFPSTATFSFRSVTCTSRYLTLSGTELTDNAGHALQPSTALDTQLIDRYDVPPYVNSAEQSGSVPFLDIDNHYVLAGAQYDPQVLAGLSMSKIAAQLDDPTGAVGAGDRSISRDPDSCNRPGPPLVCGSRLIRMQTQLENSTIPVMPAWAPPRWLPATATFLSLGGLGVSTYLTIAHYGSSITLACPDTGTINCEKVTTSPQSVISGVPVAVLGLVFFAAMLALNTPRAWRNADLLPRLSRIGLAVVGVGFAFYLIYTELFTINAICLWCTAAHVLALILFGLVMFGDWLARPIADLEVEPGLTS